MEKYTKKKIITVIIQYMSIAVLVAADLFIKKIVIDNIALHEDVKFIEGFYGWTYVQNTGMAWGMFNDNPVLLSVITGVAVLLILIYITLPVKRAWAYEICIPMILAGGLANTIDRISRGFVVDYIKTLYVDFPVYNFADCLITCGAAILMIYLIYEIVRDTKKEKSEKMKETKSE